MAHAPSSLEAVEAWQERVNSRFLLGPIGQYEAGEHAESLPDGKAPILHHQYIHSSAAGAHTSFGLVSPNDSFSARPRQVDIGSPPHVELSQRARGPEPQEAGCEWMLPLPSGFLPGNRDSSDRLFPNL